MYIWTYTEHYIKFFHVFVANVLYIANYSYVEYYL